MKTELIKSMYKVLMVLFLVLLISTMILSFCHLYGYMPKVFMGVFVLIGFINLYEYKEITEKKELSVLPMVLIATTLVVCIGYVTWLFFMFGREFVRLL